MTEKTFQFDLVSPEKSVISEHVAHVVIPAISGEMGVGADHEKYVVALKEGDIKLYRSDKNETPEIIRVEGGFADITGDQCTVLADKIAMDVVAS